MDIKLKNIFVIVCVMCGFAVQPAMADIYGLPNGRSANLDNMATLSIEGGAQLSGDVSNFAGRFNAKFSDDGMVFVDAGLVTFDAGFGGGGDLDGLVVGLGVFYQLRNFQIFRDTDNAVKASFHTGTLEDGGFEPDIDELAFDYIISGNQLSTTNLGWYGNVGIHRLSFGDNNFSDSEIEVLIGGGVLGKLSFGEWYAGIDVIDELLILGGIRYNF